MFQVFNGHAPFPSSSCFSDSCCFVLPRAVFFGLGPVCVFGSSTRLTGHRLSPRHVQSLPEDPPQTGIMLTPRHGNLLVALTPRGQDPDPGKRGSVGAPALRGGFCGEVRSRPGV